MKDFITTLLRILKHSGRVGILNIVGLGIGFTFISLITMFIIREFSYDRFHSKADLIYMMEIFLKNEDGTSHRSRMTSLEDINTMKEQIPGISNITFLNYSYFDWDNGTWIKYKDNSYQLQRMAFTDPAFADVFSFNTVSGNLAEALNDPYSIILTEENAIKIFGGQFPIGKNVLLNNRPVTVKAVIESNPARSSIRLDGLINYKASQYFTGHLIDDYSNLAFFEMDPNTDMENIESAGRELFLQEFPEEEREQFKGRMTLKMIPLKESYFNEGEPFDPMLHGNKTLVKIILLIGILILVLAIINYINLSYASSLKHQKELSVRSVLGASRGKLIVQFITESIFICLIAFALALILIEIPLKWFNTTIDNPLFQKQFFKLPYLILVGSIAILAGLIAGIFPAMSATRPASLQGYRSGNSARIKSGRWKVLVVFQMMISTGLISFTIAIVKQVRFVRDTDMGFHIENVITVPVHKLSKNKKEAYIQIVKNKPETESLALSTTYLNTFNEWGGILNENGSQKEISYFVIQANADFIPATGLQLDDGRNFQTENISDNNTCIINETAIKTWGLTEPLSATISGKQIVGTVKDFHIQSLHYRVGPIVIFNSPVNKTGLATIRFKAGNKSQISNYLTSLRENWESLNPEIPFEYEFLDQRLQNMYEKDERLLDTFSGFSLLAIIIASLGLFGLVSIMSETIVKEIGIRKINGAKVSEILIMLNKDIVILVIIAFLTATPIAWYCIGIWLQSFEYKTDLSWWIFGLSGVTALLIALLTLSWQSWRAATRNPVEALRYE